jgi:YqxM protein
MRSKRLTKFKKKNKRLFLVTQVLGIWYCVLLTVIYLSSSTGAAFNDVEVIENRLHVFWENDDSSANGDKSSLKFQNKVGFECTTGFYSLIKNVGSKDMQGTTTFVLYYNASEDPNRKKLGIEVGRGTIPALKSGESFNLTYLPELIPSSGNYKFMAFQRTGHEGSGQLWSDPISVSDNQIKVCDQWMDTGKEETKVNERIDAINNNEPNSVDSTTSDVSNNTYKQEINDVNSNVPNKLISDPNTEKNMDATIHEVNDKYKNLEGE